MVCRALVTGGSGFIGTHLVSALLDRCGAVSNIDVAAPRESAQSNLWLRTDLLDVSGVKERIREFRPDVIFNLAAIADISLGRRAFEVNTRGLSNIIAAARELEARPRIVHASTQLVVGPEHDATGPRDYAPYTDYGQSKADSEEILWKEAMDLPWTIVRPTTIWGPHHASFPATIWRYLEKGWYLVPNGKDPVRSYGYVENIVDQMIAILDAEPKRVDHKVFYVSDRPINSSLWLDGFSRAFRGRPARRMPEAFLRVAAIAGDLTARVGAPSPINSGRLYRMITDYPVPLAQTFEVLGEGRISLQEGIDRTVEWLKHGYGKIGERY